MSELDELQDKYDHLGEAFDGIQRDLWDAESLVMGLRDELDEKQQEADGYAGEASDLRARLSDLEERLRAAVTLDDFAELVDDLDWILF